MLLCCVNGKGRAHSENLGGVVTISIGRRITNNTFGRRGLKRRPEVKVAQSYFFKSFFQTLKKKYLGPKSITDFSRKILIFCISKIIAQKTKQNKTKQKKNKTKQTNKQDKNKNK